MQLKTKVEVLSVAIIVLMSVNAGLMYLSFREINQLQVVQSANMERERAYLSLKSNATRAIQEIANYHQGLREHAPREAVELDLAQFTLAVAGAREDVAAVHRANERYNEAISVRNWPVDLLSEARKNTALENRQNHELEALASPVIAELARLERVDADDGLFLALENRIDRDLSPEIDALSDEAQADIDLDAHAVVQFQRLASAVLGVVGTLAIGLLLYFAAWFARSIVQRIDKIGGTMVAYRNGRQLARVPDIGRDEVGRLGAIFNKMADQLAESHAALINSSKLSALGEMAGGLAHEVNTPLCVIGGRASQIKRELARPSIDGERIQELAMSIEKTTFRIARIVSGLRTFARDGAHEPLRKTSVADILADVQALCSERFKIHGVELTFDRKHDAMAIDCRAVQVVQVLVNILNNAFDAVDGQDGPKWVCVETTDRGDLLEFSVTDSGKGIPKAVQDKMFQPFFTTKEVGKGTGLGLSIARGIVADHGGVLAIDNTCPNTRFSMSFGKTLAAEPGQRLPEVKGAAGEARALALCES